MVKKTESLHFYLSSSRKSLLLSFIDEDEVRFWSQLFDPVCLVGDESTDGSAEVSGAKETGPICKES